jgi:hypothetical protein
LARLPPPRHPVHRRLRVPDLRKGDDSPLRTSLPQAIPKTCRFPSSKIHAIRLCAQSATCQTPSPPSADASPPRSLTRSPAARAAYASGYDAVVLDALRQPRARSRS